MLLSDADLAAIRRRLASEDILSQRVTRDQGEAMLRHIDALSAALAAEKALGDRLAAALRAADEGCGWSRRGELMPTERGIATMAWDALDRHVAARAGQPPRPADGR